MGGGRRLGIRRAASPRQLAEGLRRERMLLVRSYRLPAWASPGGEVRRLSLADTVALNEQLAQLLSRGVPLVEALEVVASTVTSGSKPIIVRMRELVSAGSSFADACQRVGVFDRVTVAVYRAAERTGDLSGAAKQLSVTARRQAQVQGKAVTLMVYPAVVLTICSAVVLFILMVVVPGVGKSLSSMRVELPWFSGLILGAGTIMARHWIWVVAVIVSLILAAIVWRRSVGRTVMRAARRLPAFKSVLLAQESTRFFSTMAAMTRSGVPLADALGVANEAVGMPQLRKELDTLRTKLIEGGVLRNLIENVTALPIATRRLLIAAERAGDLETAFDTLAKDMAEETDRRASRLVALLEPLLIVGMFLVIGPILIALFLPMIQAAAGGGR